MGREELEGLLRRVRGLYRAENPFHNLRHAFSVTLAAYVMAARTAVGRAALRAEDRLACVLAALCHDLDHPGVNNEFLVRPRPAPGPPPARPRPAPGPPPARPRL